MTPRRYALVAGGGTAGHLQPGLAIAEALVDAGHDRGTIEFVGSSRGQDRLTLEGRGFPFTLLPGRGIVRSLRPSDLVANLGAVAGLAAASVLGLGVVIRARPRVVVSVGGYASLAASLGAVVRRVPLVLVNVDAVPGASNRLLGRFARASAVGWEGSPLPRAVVTGTPVRPEIARVVRAADQRRAARRELGLPPDRPTVAVFGGSLGARRINGAVVDLADRWKDRDDRSIYHVVGRREWDEALRAGGEGSEGGPTNGLALVRVAYEDHMDLVYAAADVVVCRAGAMTVAELAVAGVPSVLVPLPGAPGDHQTANARVLERAGAALLLPDGRCDAAALEMALDGLLSEPGLLDAMGTAATGLGRPDAAAAGARVVEASAAPAPSRPGGGGVSEPVRAEVLRSGDHPAAVHIVGIGGAGMSAIATVLHAMGHVVTGSDLKASGVTDRLQRAGIGVAIGHSAANVGAADLVTVSSAIPETNPEVVEARRRGIGVLSRAELLAALASLRRCVAVAGTHGKTTTASMLALVLVEAGLRPSFLIGGDVNEIGTNAVWDQGEWLVVEADESDGTFLSLVPDIAVVTNVEADHLDHYGSFAAVRSAFEAFLTGARGPRVVGGDDAVAAQIGLATGAEIVGTDPGSTVRMVDVELARSSLAFGLVDRSGVGLGRLAVPVPGLHNARNAAVAAVAALAVGVPFESLARALARFAGVARRFEFRGTADGVTFVDDYAHLPSEIRAALAAARDGGWPRVLTVFQPHRYSRTADLWAEFGSSFADADEVVVTDVYGAGEAPVPGVSGRLVADAARRQYPGKPVHYAARRSDLRALVGGLLRAGDLCLTLGAGDLTSLPDELLADADG